MPIDSLQQPPIDSASRRACIARRGAVARPGRVLPCLLMLLLGLPWAARAAAQPVRAGSAPQASAKAVGPAAAAPRYTVRIDAPAPLREALQRGLDIEHWRDFGSLHEQQLRELVDAVPRQARSVLEALGYFSPRVQAELDASRHPQLVLLKVSPGEPTHVASVQLVVRGPDGREMPGLAAELLRHWGLRAGGVFVSAQWQAAKGDALLRLNTRRYAGARIAASQALVDPATRQARLTVRFDTGPDYRFGAMSIHGLHRYPASVVRSLVPWSPGDAYSQAQLLQLQARLQNSGYFANATVAAPVAQARGDALPVTVDVVEQRAQQIAVGIGYSSNTGARTQFDYADLNLFGRALRLDTKLRLDTLQQSLDATLRLPRRADGGDYSIDAQVQHSDIQGLTTRSQTLGLQRHRIDGAVESVESLQFINEQQQISGGGVSSSMALMPGYTWTRRRLDSALDPRRGNLLSVEIAGGARALLSDQDFVRLYLHGLQYVEFDRRNQLLLLGELGDVLSRSADGIPQQELFRAGGVGSVRGYAYQSLGVVQDGAVVGGRALLTASIEGVHWVAPRWGAAVFVDAGNAADGFRTLHPVVGYGVGVRWRSPAGLISVDIAHGRATGATRLEFNAGISF